MELERVNTLAYFLEETIAILLFVVLAYTLQTSSPKIDCSSLDSSANDVFLTCKRRMMRSKFLSPKVLLSSFFLHFVLFYSKISGFNGISIVIKNLSGPN